MTTNLLILGASARAAAMSAEMCGHRVWCADRFADVDLQAIADAEICEDYPNGLPALMTDAPSGPWIYTGALENRPDLLERMISKRHPLLGNAPDVVRIVRDPENWTAALKQARLPHCDFRRSEKLPTASEVPRDATWLVKPIRGASGTGIQIWNNENAVRFSEANLNPRDFYWQQFTAGTPIAAIFVAARRTAVLLGTSKQLIGEDWCRGEMSSMGGIDGSPKGGTGGSPTNVRPSNFSYCGSIGPLHFDDAITEQLQAIGSTFAREFNLRGLFGVDAILTPANEIVPVEINPRYTASIEVLERASQLGTLGTRGKQLKSIQLHLEACLDEKLPDRVMPVTNAVAGKAILYMPTRDMDSDEALLSDAREWRFSTASAQWATVRNLSSGRPVVADIPQAESPLHAGQPILTLLAEGKDEEEVRAELLVQSAECYDILREWNERE